MHYSVFHSFPTNSRAVGIFILTSWPLLEKSYDVKTMKIRKHNIALVHFSKWLSTFNYKALEIKRATAFGKLFQATENSMIFE